MFFENKLLIYVYMLVMDTTEKIQKKKMNMFNRYMRENF